MNLYTFLKYISTADRMGANSLNHSIIFQHHNALGASYYSHPNKRVFDLFMTICCLSCKVDTRESCGRRLEIII